MKSIIESVFFLFFLVLISPFVLAQAPQAASWWGIVSIDSNTSTATNGSVVEAYIGSSVVANVTVGQWQSGYYLIDVPCSSGQNVTIRVYNITANESARTCVPGQSTQLNLSVNRSANGVACIYAQGCSGGYCIHGYCRAASTYCGDGYCDSGESCSTCTADCGSCGGGAPGGGAAVGATTATTTTTVAPVTETETVTKIENGTSTTVNISQSDTLKIESISVEVKNTVNNVQITVKESSLPAGANVAISSDKGAVYKYLEIIKVNIQDSDINKVKIKFKVEKSWLNANGIDPATVALQRLSGTSWTKLTTTKLSEDSTYIYFESESPGLSVFAITGEKKVVTTTTVAPPVTTTTTKPLPPVTLGTPQLYVAILIGIFVLLVLLYFVFKKPKRSEYGQHAQS